MSDRADPRRHAPAAARNRKPILAVLRCVLPASGRVLEVASGGGEYAAFDADLRGRDASWGVRDLGDVAAFAARHGLAHIETVTMPANDRSVAFRKAAA